MRISAISLYLQSKNVSHKYLLRALKNPLHLAITTCNLFYCVWKIWISYNLTSQKIVADIYCEGVLIHSSAAKICQIMIFFWKFGNFTWKSIRSQNMGLKIIFSIKTWKKMKKLDLLLRHVIYDYAHTSTCILDLRLRRSRSHRIITVLNVSWG